MRGNPFFVQKRPGKKGKDGKERIFSLIKFRTMLYPQTRDGQRITDNERLEYIEKGVDILSDEERLNRYGRFLRATSFDELPELLNILKGEMSIIGPRPLSTIYLPYYTENERRRHDLRPGLSGMAQIHGRNSASWGKRFEYDIKYVDSCSFFLDIKILFQTVFMVFKHEGICQGEQRPIAFNIERQKEMEEITINAHSTEDC